MFKIEPIDQINKTEMVYKAIRRTIYKIGGALEVLIVLSIWFYILNDKASFAGFSIEEIISYIIAGNIIGIITGFLLHKTIRQDLIKNNSNLLLYSPFKYLGHILFKGFGRIFVPFITAVVFQYLLMYFFSEYLVSYPENSYMIVIFIIIILAFITEFLIAYLLNMFKFWQVESPEVYRIVMRVKKIISGGYFPLTILPLIMVKISLIFPFAYTFFVPVQLYLKKLSLQDAYIGIFIQICWIIIIYAVIRYFWKKKYIAYQNSLK